MLYVAQQYYGVAMCRIPACLALCIAASGCASQAEKLKVMGAVLTSAAVLETGQRTPVLTFGRNDYIWMFVDVSWPDVLLPAGPHRLVFSWYRNGQLISRTDYISAHGHAFVFAHTPTTLETHRAAAALGPGHFRVETVVDDVVFASRDFDITP
jgi:hypothetical protein